MKTKLISVLALMTIAATASIAKATTKYTWMENDGRACKSYYYGDDVRYTISGVENACSNCSKTIWCPVELIKDSDLISVGPVTISDVTILYYDGNDAQQDFSCRPQLRDSNGGLTLGPLWYTPAGRSGSYYTPYTWWDPFAGLDFQFSNYKQNGLAVGCTLPATGGGGNSIIYEVKATFAYQNQ